MICNRCYKEIKHKDKWFIVRKRIYVHGEYSCVRTVEWHYHCAKSRYLTRGKDEEWQDIERTFTSGERVLSVRIDCTSRPFEKEGLPNDFNLPKEGDDHEE